MMFMRNVYCGHCRHCIGLTIDGEYLPPIYCLGCEEAVNKQREKESRQAAEYREAVRRDNAGG